MKLDRKKERTKEKKSKTEKFKRRKKIGMVVNFHFNLTNPILHVIPLVAQQDFPVFSVFSVGLFIFFMFFLFFPYFSLHVSCFFFFHTLYSSISLFIFFFSPVAVQTPIFNIVHTIVSTYKATKVEREREKRIHIAFLLP